MAACNSYYLGLSNSSGVVGLAPTNNAAGTYNNVYFSQHYHGIGPYFFK